MKVTHSLTIVGNSTDFVDEATNQGPDWEHLVLLRLPGSRAVAIEALQSPPESRLPGRRFVDAGMLYRLARTLRRSEAVLAQNEHAGYRAALALAASFPKPPLFIIFHGHEWWRKKNRLLATVTRQMTSAQFLCLSDSLRDLVIQEYGIASSRVHTTGYGVDARFFTPAPLSGRGCIVSAGTASRDYRILAEASAGLDVQIKIAADSTWHRARLNISDDEIPSNVEIFSAGTYPRLRTLYQSALFVVVPLLDVRYACGYAVIAEAMAMGKVVIATRTGCPSDLIIDGVTGMYVPPGDAGALRKAMQRLLADPALATEMGKAARELVEHRFNLDAYVGRLRDMIASTGGHRAPRRCARP